MLIKKLIWGLQASTVDVETAFLHENLQEEIYINITNYKSLIQVLKGVGFIKKVQSMSVMKMG